MLTDHELLTAVRAEPLSPLAAELVRRFADDLADMDALEAALVKPVSLDTSPRPVA